MFVHLKKLSHSKIPFIFVSFFTLGVSLLLQPFLSDFVSWFSCSFMSSVFGVTFVRSVCVLYYPSSTISMVCDLKESAGTNEQTTLREKEQELANSFTLAVND